MKARTQGGQLLSAFWKCSEICPLHVNVVVTVAHGKAFLSPVSACVKGSGVGAGGCKLPMSGAQRQELQCGTRSMCARGCAGLEPFGGS